MVAELNMVCHDCLQHTQYKFKEVKPVDVIASVKVQIEILTVQKELQILGEQTKLKFKDVFSKIPHINELPTDIYCRIWLKNASKLVQMRTYSTPCKYHKAWAILIKQYLNAGRIRPSNSDHASPAFLVPKSDTVVLPWWVNDYCVLNVNTVLDAHPLPRVDDILADCTKGKVWSKLDMTNSFFQMWVHPNDIHLTTVVVSLAHPSGVWGPGSVHQ